ncbi:microprocessor complex subunit DGCR8 [Bradysia coprophila]|uniref:microprocessor complex subunit DGCR8 n=1 Tax=Bradysia coprophila TaxID=38358 RepID=UPI00187D9217|nr:microprocessor complex subunit DGCR8 [Bradysia coprophila]XP_037051598.1 microprocessor complex subunit DGCR8 [Bradysia coprophila]XP_037051599.1 microprocessor complex subunit DGCR8 [Bradysia coprophila]
MSEGECPMSKRMKLDSDADESNLAHFDVIDEVQGDGSGSEGGFDDDSSDTDLNDNDIENMLNEGLPEELKNKKVEAQYDEKFKIVLEEKGQNHFEVLPEGWVKVTHNSGIPLYLHTQARVCTVSRPYFLGPGSVRKHQIPITAIPCLSYKKALEKEEQLAENNDTVETAVNGIDDSNVDGENSDEPKPITTNAVIETVKENLEKQSLSAEQITEYCKKLFHFKEIRVMRFKSWHARRKFTKNKKHIKNLQRPSLPEGTKLISFPIHNTDGQNQSSRHGREWIMNPNGKSFVCILHEYVQHALKKQPTYEFKEMENAATPYSATVSINNLKYGTGYGTSKKQAKSEAARETLEVLIPEMRDKITGDNKNPNKQKLYKDLSVFDEIRIEDPRVTEFCAKTTEPLPHSILLTCLQRNFGLADIKIDYQVNTTKHKKNEFKMTVGKHTVNVVCKNKRDGKHQASQAILQLLHPHIKTWGSLLRLYGNHSVKSFKEKKQEEQEITVLQSKAAINQPNYAILEKLQLEMSKVKDCRDAIKPIGTFVPSLEDLPIASGSTLNNVLL